MEYILTFLTGTIVGILITIPMGPTSFYVVQRTLGHETKKGLHVALGAVIVDILYALIITLGLIALIRPYIQNPTIQIIFSIFLIAYGIKMLVFDRKKALANQGNRGKLKKSNEKFERGHYYVLLGVSMTLANPTLFFSWVAILSFVMAHNMLIDETVHKLIFSFSAGFGSLLWFLVVAQFVRNKRHAIPQSFVRRAGMVTALVIIGFGVYFIVTVIQNPNGAV